MFGDVRKKPIFATPDAGEPPACRMPLSRKHLRPRNRKLTKRIIYGGTTVIPEHGNTRFCRTNRTVRKCFVFSSGLRAKDVLPEEANFRDPSRGRAAGLPNAAVMEALARTKSKLTKRII